MSDVVCIDSSEITDENKQAVNIFCIFFLCSSFFALELLIPLNQSTKILVSNNTPLIYFSFQKMKYPYQPKFLEVRMQPLI
jgi:hypothetical protein